MTTIKDFTPAQAKRWVDQEFAKITPANAAYRVASEQSMLEFQAPDFDLPNSEWAHQELINRIAKAFSVRL